MTEKISYTLTEKEVSFFLNQDYGLGSKLANQKVGAKIVETINSFEISKERECFYAQRVKDLTIVSLRDSKNVGKIIKYAIASNYFHYAVRSRIQLFLFFRKNPQYAE